MPSIQLVGTCRVWLRRSFKICAKLVQTEDNTKLKCKKQCEVSLLLAKTAVRGDAKSATLGREKSHFPHPKVALLLRHASLFSVSVGFFMHSCHGSSTWVVHVLETCVPCESLCRVSFEKKGRLLCRSRCQKNYYIRLG